MTNIQLLLSIGIPSLLVIMSWLSNNTRLSNLERRMDSNTDRLDGRVNSLHARMDQRFDYLVSTT